jgi:hypothetical protein
MGDASGGVAMHHSTEQQWEEFLNPAVMRPRLVAASVYLACFEALKDAVVSRVRDFFWTGFDESGDTIDPKYRSDVLARNKSPLYASLDWLREMGAIDEPDIATFNQVKKCRNTLAHRLLSMLASDGLPGGFEERFAQMVVLLRKIEIWWITNVEIPTDPSFDGHEVDEGDIVPGRAMIIQLLCEIALGDEKQSQLHYNAFRRREQSD